VEGIAEFIAGLNPDIAYSLLAFHPDFIMMDFPATPALRRPDASRRLMSI
jgi:pyruvate formate lyase activating enzyme